MRDELIEECCPVIKGATLSPDRMYHYHLYRTWDVELPHMVWLMLNPSTADASTDDLTIKKCMGFARQEGMGGSRYSTSSPTGPRCPMICWTLRAQE